jgi:hypothetical protein
LSIYVVVLLREQESGAANPMEAARQTQWDNESGADSE